MTFANDKLKVIAEVENIEAYLVQQANIAGISATDLATVTVTLTAEINAAADVLALDALKFGIHDAVHFANTLKRYAQESAGSDVLLGGKGASIVQQGGTAASPYVPKLAGSISLLDAFWVKVIGTYAFTINSGVDGLRIIDVTDPNNLSVVSTLTFGSSLDDADISGKHLYVTDRLLGSETLFIVDVSNVAAPVLKGTLALGQNPTSINAPGGKYIYVTEENAGVLKTIDVTDPDNPFVVSSFAVPGGFPQKTIVSSGFAYVSTSSTPDFNIIDVSNPKAPSARGSLTLGSFVPDIEVSGAHVFLVDQNPTPSRVQVIDASDPDNPSVVGAALLDVPSNALAVKVSGDYLYVTDEAQFELWIFLISNRAAPVEVGRFPLGVPSSPNGIDVVGGDVYLADGFSDTLKLIDISGINVQSAVVHALKAYTAQVLEDLRVGRDLQVRGGFTAAGHALIEGDLGVGGSILAVGGFPLALGYVDGLTVSRPSATTVQIGAGRCRDEDDTFDIVVASDLLIDITATGALGRNVETAEAADTWYAVMVLGDSTNVLPSSVMLVNAADLGTFAFPTGFNKKRRNGWMRNDASSALRNIQTQGQGRDRRVVYGFSTRTDLTVFTNQEPTVFTPADLSEWVPPTSVEAELFVEVDSSNDDFVEFRTPGSGLANGDGRRFYGKGQDFQGRTYDAVLDGSQITEFRRNGITGTGASLFVYGYLDRI